MPIELGASIFVKVNHILYNAAETFNLPLAGFSEGTPGDYIAIYDGETFVYQSVKGEGWWWDAARLWWKYGTSPYSAVKLVKSTVGTFLKLYEAPYFPFRSLTQRVFELGLNKITAVTGEQYLAENKINPDFSREIIQAATRVNYASNLAYIHGLEAMVSFATDDASSVLGGNWKIFDHMVNASQAALNSNTKVASISTAPDHDYTSPKYTISTVDTSSSSSSSSKEEEYPITFDNVVLATPWQFSDISTSSDVLRHKIDEIPYMKLHVTLFSSPFKLRPGFFGLEDGVKAPSNVYTTLGADETAGKGQDSVGRSGFYSISTLKTAINPSNSRREYVYKIFSAQPVTHKFLTDLLGADVPETFTSSSSQDFKESTMVDPISWYHAHWFHSYPLELPRVTFQDPVVGSGVYYTGGIESFISTMETSALMGKNVARLIADDFAGVKREGQEASHVYGQQAPLGSDEL